MPRYVKRLQKWFDVDTSTKYYLKGKDDAKNWYYAAKYLKKGDDPYPEGDKDKFYLVKGLGGSGANAYLEAPNKPFVTREIPGNCPSASKPTRKTRLQEFFDIDTSRKLYIDKDNWFYGAKFLGDNIHPPSSKGKVGTHYLVNNLRDINGTEKLDAPNPPFDTGDGA